MDISWKRLLSLCSVLAFGCHQILAIFYLPGQLRVQLRIEVDVSIQMWEHPPPMAFSFLIFSYSNNSELCPLTPPISKAELPSSGSSCLAPQRLRSLREKKSLIIQISPVCFPSFKRQSLQISLLLFACRCL